MRFCPECKTKLKRTVSGMQCPDCSYAEDGSPEPARARREGRGAEELNVFADGEGDAALPTIKKECEKCGNGEAVWWMLQTRSADEPTTQFFRCTKCRHTWRDYS